MPFNPYRDWLGVDATPDPPGKRRPAKKSAAASGGAGGSAGTASFSSDEKPNYYRLLGLPEFSGDAAEIQEAFRRQYGKVHRYQTGKHRATALALLRELAAACDCLTHPDRRRAYDAELEKALGRSAPSAGAVPTATPLAANLAEVLVHQGAIARDKVPQILQALDGNQTPSRALLATGLVDDYQAARALAAYYCCEYVDLAQVEPATGAAELVDPSVARRLGILPLRRSQDGMELAVSDAHPEIVDQYRFLLGPDLTIRVAAASQILERLGVNARPSHSTAAKSAQPVPPSAGPSAQVAGNWLKPVAAVAAATAMAAVLIALVWTRFGTGGSEMPQPVAQVTNDARSPTADPTSWPWSTGQPSEPAEPNEKASVTQQTSNQDASQQEPAAPSAIPETDDVSAGNQLSPDNSQPHNSGPLDNLTENQPPDAERPATSGGEPAFPSAAGLPGPESSLPDGVSPAAGSSPSAGAAAVMADSTSRDGSDSTASASRPRPAAGELPAAWPAASDKPGRWLSDTDRGFLLPIPNRQDWHSLGEMRLESVSDAQLALTAPEFELSRGSEPGVWQVKSTGGESALAEFRVSTERLEFRWLPDATRGTASSLLRGQTLQLELSADRALRFPLHDPLTLPGQMVGDTLTMTVSPAFPEARINLVQLESAQPPLSSRFVTWGRTVATAIDPNALYVQFEVSAERQGETGTITVKRIFDYDRWLANWGVAPRMRSFIAADAKKQDLGTDPASVATFLQNNARLQQFAPLGLMNEQLDQLVRWFALPLTFAIQVESASNVDAEPIVWAQSPLREPTPLDNLVGKWEAGREPWRPTAEEFQLDITFPAQFSNPRLIIHGEFERVTVNSQFLAYENQFTLKGSVGRVLLSFPTDQEIEIRGIEIQAPYRPASWPGRVYGIGAIRQPHAGLSSFLLSREFLERQP